MPKFDLLLADQSATISTEDFESGIPIVLFYFKNNCFYCNKETKEIVARMNDFKEVKLVFITSENVTMAKKYQQNFLLDSFKNVLVASDTSKFFEKHYKPNGTPMIVVYDKRKQLRGVFSGAPEINSLIKATQEL